MARDAGDLVAGLLEIGALQYSRMCERNGYPVPAVVAALLASERQETPALPSCSPMLLDYDQVAERLAVSRRTVDRVTGRGELPTVKVGGVPRVRLSDLEDYVAGLEVRSGRH